MDFWEGRERETGLITDSSSAASSLNHRKTNEPQKKRNGKRIEMKGLLIGLKWHRTQKEPVQTMRNTRQRNSKRLWIPEHIEPGRGNRRDRKEKKEGTRAEAIDRLVVYHKIQVADHRLYNHTSNSTLVQQNHKNMIAHVMLSCSLFISLVVSSIASTGQQEGRRNEGRESVTSSWNTRPEELPQMTRPSWVSWKDLSKIHRSFYSFLKHRENGSENIYRGLVCYLLRKDVPESMCIRRERTRHTAANESTGNGRETEWSRQTKSYANAWHMQWLMVWFAVRNAFVLRLDSCTTAGITASFSPPSEPRSYHRVTQFWEIRDAVTTIIRYSNGWRRRGAGEFCCKRHEKRWRMDLLQVKMHSFLSWRCFYSNDGRRICSDHFIPSSYSRVSVCPFLSLSFSVSLCPLFFLSRRRIRPFDQGRSSVCAWE